MGKKEINDDEEEAREIKKTFTKKSKKIGRPVYFLDTPFRKGLIRMLSLLVQPLNYK